MAFLNETIRGTGPLGSLRAMFSHLADSWTRYGEFRRTFEELNRLSSRELADIGISRSMITRLAYEAAYGKAA